MINKKLFTVITFLCLLSCGYQPIYSSKESVVLIKKIELAEKNSINNKIRNVLKIYQKNDGAERFYDLKISSEKNKVILTKNSKGDPKLFALNILIKIEVIENNFLKETKSFEKTLNHPENREKIILEIPGNCSKNDLIAKNHRKKFYHL